MDYIGLKRPTKNFFPVFHISTVSSRKCRTILKPLRGRDAQEENCVLQKRARKKGWKKTRRGQVSGGHFIAPPCPGQLNPGENYLVISFTVCSRSVHTPAHVCLASPLPSCHLCSPPVFPGQSRVAQNSNAGGFKIRTDCR